MDVIRMTWITIDAVSSMLGDMEIDEYEFVKNSLDYRVGSYARTMRTAYNRYVVDAAILEVEHVFGDERVSGARLYNWLLWRGYGKTTSRTVLDIFVSDDELKDRFAEEYDDEVISYDFTYRERLGLVGLTERRYYMHYLLGQIISVTPIHSDLHEIPDGPPIPPVPEYPFTQIEVQASMSLSYGDKKRGRHLEMFGTFWARDDQLDDAIDKAEILLNDFALSHGYGGLTEDGNGWAYHGVQDDIDHMILYGYAEVMKHESDATVWIDDIDYSRPERFREQATMIPEWWTDDQFDDARRKFDAETS